MRIKASRHSSASDRGPTTLRAGAAWAVAGNIAYASSQWAILVILTRLGSAAEVGQYAAALAFSTPVFQFTGLQLRGIQASDATNHYAFATYRRLRSSTVAISLIILAGLVGAGGSSSLVGGLTLLVGMSKAVEGMSDVHYGALQKADRLDLVALSQIARSIAGTAGFCILLLMSSDPRLAVAGQAAAWAAVYWLVDRRLVSHLDSGVVVQVKDTSWRSFVPLLYTALPLGVVVMLVSLQANMPRYFIEQYFTQSALGEFAATGALALVGSLVVAAVGQAATPRLARHMAADQQVSFSLLLQRLTLLAVGLGLVGVAGALFAGKWALTLVFGVSYGEQAPLLAWLMVAGTVSYAASILGFGMTAAGLFRPQLPLFVCVTLISGIACLLLVPKFGLVGGAWALTIASAAQWLGSIGILRIKVKAVA